MNHLAYIALGSNLGDREQSLNQAVEKLRAVENVSVKMVSSFWETSPVGGPAGQGLYLNAAAELDTTLAPGDLMSKLLEIEQVMGRVREVRFGPRTIDIDLLLFDQAIINEDDLIVPHPRMHERKFVLGPLAEIAPTARHPLRQDTTIEMLAALVPESSGSSLAGKRAVVTGSSSGIGKATALALAQRGADVTIHTRTSFSEAAQVAQRIQTMGRHSAVMDADLSIESLIPNFAQRAWAESGPVDIWINNAGADTLTGELGKAEFGTKLESLWAVDVRATIQLSRLIGEKMKAKGQGCIINIGWDQAESGMEGDSGQLFSAAKGAVMAFTRSLAIEMAPEARVNCVAPGWIKTAWGQSASAEWQERAKRESLLERWGKPEDVAHAVCWLASADAEFVNGQVIHVNGGAARRGG